MHTNSHNQLVIDLQLTFILTLRIVYDGIYSTKLEHSNIVLVRAMSVLCSDIIILFYYHNSYNHCSFS